MRIPRIYSPQILDQGKKIQLDAQAYHHLVRVLRLRDHSPIRVFDGKGKEFNGFLEIQNRTACANLTNLFTEFPESQLKIHLGQAVSRGEKMDYVIQKAVELGVDRITPLLSEWTAIKFSEERLEKRLQHWQSILIAACEQCGRNQLPILSPPLLLDSWVAQRTESLKLVLHPKGGQCLSDLPAPNNTLALLVGAEGGFSMEEIALSQQNGFIIWQLGPRILRTETAALAGLTALQSQWGDLR